jgi:hypothetical protein
MTTFDLAEVRGFTADIHARMDRRVNGEGSDCTALDADLRRYTELCREFYDQVQHWEDAVFSGRVVFDPDAERVWQEGGWRLHSQATEILNRGQETKAVCYDLECKRELQDAIEDLYEMLDGWLTPKLSVGPAARRWRYPDQAASDEARRRVASLPALPSDWQPTEPAQQETYRKLRTS